MNESVSSFVSGDIFEVIIFHIISNFVLFHFQFSNIKKILKK